MKYIILLVLFTVISCTPKPKTIKVVSNYKFGSELAEFSDDLIYNFTPIGNFCLNKSSKVVDSHPLISSRSTSNTHVRYNYNIEEVILWFNKLNNCNDESNIIYLNSVESIISYYERMRYHGYSLQINASAKHICNDKYVELSSTSKKSISKSGKLISLGAISEQNVQSLIATIIINAYYEAISDIFNKINKQCI